MFCSKHSITFENRYLLSCWFHCYDIWYIKFRFCKTCTLTNSVPRVSSIEYSIFDPKGLKFLICLSLGLSHLNEHRFGYNFQDSLNPSCSCSLEIDDTSHYLLYCYHFSHHRVDPMNSVK